MTIMINWCADVRACLCSYSCTAPASFVSFHMHYCIHVWSDVATAGKAPTNKTLLDSPRDALNKIDHTKNTRECGCASLPSGRGGLLGRLERIITMERNVQEKRDDHRCLLALVVWMCLISFSSQNTTLFGRVCCLDIRFRWIHHVKT